MTNSPSQQITAILATGMHRSGTSALAGVLAHLGVHFGRHLLPAKPENPAGFFEHKAVFEQHERLLSALNTRYDDLRPLAEAAYDDDAVACFEKEIDGIIAAEFSQSPLWCIKDPRLCRLLPIWCRILERQGISPQVVIAIRHPIEVAASIATRDKMGPEAATVLWLRYTVDLLDGSAHLPRVFVAYDDLMDNWLAAAEHIASTLQIRWPIAPDSARQQIEKFLSPALRHHDAKKRRDKLSAPFRDERLLSHAVQLYEELSNNSHKDDAARDKLLHSWRDKATRYLTEFDAAECDATLYYQAYDYAMHTAIEGQREKDALHGREVARLGEERSALLAEKDRLWSAEVSRVADDYKNEIARISTERDQIVAAKTAAKAKAETRLARITPLLPLVSIIVVNFNGRRFLQDLFDSLFKQSYPYLEVIMVDNASSDDSVAFTQEHFPHVKVVQSATNLGFSGGNNLGVTESSGSKRSFVALINNDTIVDPEWLASMMDEMKDLKVGAVGSKILFAKRFVRLSFTSPTFCPQATDRTSDTRQLGFMLTTNCGFEGVSYRKPVFEQGFHGPEADGTTTYRWTRDTATLLLPIDEELSDARVALTVRSHDCLTGESFTVRSHDRVLYTGELTADWHVHEISVPTELLTHSFSVINNAGSDMDPLGNCGDRGIFQTDEGQFDQSEDVTALCGCSMLIRRETLQRPQLFDPDYFMYFEDSDLSWRLRKRGWRLRYTPKSIVHHIHTGTSSEGSTLFNHYVYRNRRLLSLKNGRWPDALRTLAIAIRDQSIHFVARLRGDEKRQLPADEARANRSFLVTAMMSLVKRLLGWRLVVKR